MTTNILKHYLEFFIMVFILYGLISNLRDMITFIKFLHQSDNLNAKIKSFLTPYKFGNRSVIQRRLWLSNNN